MNDISVEQVLGRIRAATKQVEPPRTLETPPHGASFAGLLQKGLDRVHESQKTAGDMAKAFELGEPGADLTKVMVAMQKARVSFEALMQVRNRVIKAYEDIMNMPV